jgi:beta-lactamase class A
MNALFAAAIALRLASIAPHFDGVVGVTAIDLESGRRYTLNGGVAFPMASVYKVPIAIALLQRVDRGEVSLTDEVTLRGDDFHAGHSPIADEAKGQPVTLSVGALLARMAGESDNSAVDYVLAHYVSPKQVMAVLHKLGVHGIDVSRPEAMIIGEILDLGDVIVTHDGYDKRIAAMTVKQHADGERKFWNDRRDTATPDGMAELMAKLYRHRVGLSAESEEILLRILRETTTGADRLRAGLPKEAVVAHKTGTMPGTLNDAGIITSPDGRHHIAIAVLTKHSHADEAVRAKIVAAAAKAVYDAITR